MEARPHLISKEIIKPSSQNPDHLKKMKFSSLDQLVPTCYFSHIFFYQADESKGLTSSSHVQISRQLKQSLSHTLPSFYPLAGRLEDDFVVDCNDTGVEFVDARVHVHLKDAIKDPNAGDLKQYLPIDPSFRSGPGEGPLLLMQITFFDCGGISLGLCFAHQVADCTSITAFLNAWASKYRGEEAEISHFSFDLANYFPPLDFSTSPLWELFMSNEKFATKRFVFDKEKLALLKQTAISSSGSAIKNPTRVELVSAFIWKNFVEVAKLNNTQAIRVFAALHAVNLRTRTSPAQLLENVFGNCVMVALATLNNNFVSNQYEGVEEFHELVSKLRSSIRKIDGDYITEAQSGCKYVQDLYDVFSLLMDGELEWCCFSSWCRFPLYEIDYGWGSPLWACTTALPMKNLIFLVSSKCGDNIEAWVNMSEENLEMLEKQIKLISTNEKDVES